MSSDTADPFYWMRMILASKRGTLMELGITPVMTSSLIMQVLVGTKILEVGNTPKERSLYNSAQKFFGIIMTICYAVVYVCSGMYGAVGLGLGVLMVLQLVVTALIVMLLDEVVQNYGMGSGTSLFITTNTCESIFWHFLSINTITTAKGTQFEGAIIHFIYCLMTRSNPIQALHESFFRANLPNMCNVLATFVVFAVVIYLQSFRVDVPIKSTRVRGQTMSYPIKLFYTSNMPIILQSSLMANLLFLLSVVSNTLGRNAFADFLGLWSDEGGRKIPIGGFAKFLVAPDSLYGALFDPFHLIIHIVIVLAACALLSQAWIDISSSTSKHVSKQLIEQNMVIMGYRNESMVKYLDKYIPTAALLGGLCIGALSLGADLIGAIGSGTGILLAVTTIYQYYELFAKEMMDLRGGISGLF
ncbi:SEC61A1 [Cordylochernes scorpioides]|uniref:SEC61A1 n=1 Tax=Cordylochernes scorpioides TaxID=51811 RepID=A0ABY6KYG1_9ARAC|nr:SEC61A1 [Cordylochernes scorpioides]